MNKLEIAKAVVTAVVGIGTTKIVSQTIANNTTRETLIQKITVSAAAVAIGSMAATATREFTGATFDNTVAFVTKMLAEASETPTVTE